MRVIWLGFVILLAIFSMIYRPFFPLPSGTMGNDFTFILPNWLDGFIWFKNNGLSPPWFTPSFCAGQPVFPDPQSAYYSLPQFLYFFLGPFGAAYATVVLCAATIFWGSYLLMRQVFSAAPLIAAFVGAILMFNGFLPHRIIVGHVGFHGFALLPLLAWLLMADFRDRPREIGATIGAGCLLAYWIHSGFGTLMIAGALAMALLALLYCMWGGSMRRVISRSAGAGLLGLALSASKLWAIFSFLSNFRRTFYVLPGASSVFDALTLIASSLFLPSQWTAELSIFRMQNIKWALEPHEWAFSFGIGTALLLLAAIALLQKKNVRIAASGQQIALLSLFILGLAWPLAFNIWHPTWNAFLKTVPILDSTSTPTRWFIVYLPVIAVGLGMLLMRVTWKTQTMLYALAACMIVNIAQTAIEPRDYYKSQLYDARPIEIADRMIRTGRFTPEIKTLGTSAELAIGDQKLPLKMNNTLVAGVSQVFCYNPVFGYRWENFSADNLTSGSVLAQENGFLNLKSPACYVYPQANACAPGDRFKNSQLDQVKNFIAYRPFDFEISSGQKTANLVSKVALVLVGIALLISLISLVMTLVKTLRAGRK